MCVCMCFQAGTGTGVIRKGEGGSLGHRLTEGDMGGGGVGGQGDEQQYRTGNRSEGKGTPRGTRGGTRQKEEEK